MKVWTEKTAKNVMRRPVTSIGTGTPLEEAIALLSEEEISGAPVVDGEGRAIGVISLYDVAQYLAGLDRELVRQGSYYAFVDPDSEEAIARWERVRQIGDRNLLREATVDDVMTPSVVAVAQDTPIPDVVRVMRTRHIHRVLVLAGDEPIGVVTTMDVLAALDDEAAGLPARPKKAARTR